MIWSPEIYISRFPLYLGVASSDKNIKHQKESRSLLGISGKVLFYWYWCHSFLATFTLWNMDRLKGAAAAILQSWRRGQEDYKDDGFDILSY